jgi:hypothetical protein
MSDLWEIVISVYWFNRSHEEMPHAKIIIAFPKCFYSNFNLPCYQQ